MEIAKISRLTIFLFFIIIVLAVYANSLQNDFIFDDYPMLVENSYIKDLRFIPRLFKTGIFHFAHSRPHTEDYYRPLQALGYSIEYLYWGLNPFGYHLTSIFIHALNGFLMFLLIYLIFKDQVLALLSAAIFCIHPIQNYLVVVISGQAHLLGAMFILLSLVNFSGYAQYRKKTSYGLSLLFFVCALLSWEGALILPLLILSCSLLLHRGRGRPAARQIIGYVTGYIVIAVLYLWLRARYLPCQNLNISGAFLTQRIRAFIWLIQSYASQLILPFGSRITLFGQSIFFALVFFAISFVFISYLLIRVIVFKDSVAILAFLFYLVGLAPVINLVHNIKSFGYVLSEHYVYMASIGFFIFMASLIIQLNARFKIISRAVIITLLTGYSALTVLNNTNYKDELTFYSYLLKIDKVNVFSYINLGKIYYRNERYDKATEQAKLLLAVKPDNWEAYLLLGCVAHLKGELSKAAELYNKTLSLNPRAIDALNNLAIVYESQGQKDKAIETFKKAIATEPEYLQPIHNLIDSLMDKRLYDEALLFCDRILELDPEDVNVRIKIGVISAELGHFNEAQRLFKEALRLDTNSIWAMQNLAASYGNTGDLTSAIAMWHKILTLDPNNEKARENLKRAKTMKNNKDIKCR